MGLERRRKSEGLCDLGSCGRADRDVGTAYIYSIRGGRGLAYSIGLAVVSPTVQRLWIFSSGVDFICQGVHEGGESGHVYSSLTKDE